MTAPAPQHYRVPSVVMVGRPGPRLDVLALDTLTVCPCCHEGGFQATELKTTTLLVCSAGCTGRRIATALGLDHWPEVRP